MKSTSKSNAAAAATTGSFSNYEFDFGLGSGLSRGGGSMNDQRNKTPAAAATSWSSGSTGISQPQPNRPPQSSQHQPWFHKPATTGMRAMQDSRPVAMAGDITGKSWVSASSGSDSGIVGGVGASKADMFGDLLGFSSGNQKPATSSSTPISMSSLNSALPLNAMKDRSMGSNRRTSQDSDPFGEFVDASAGRSKSADFFSNSSSSSSSSSAKKQADPFAAAADPFEATFGKAKPAAPLRDPLEDLWKKIPPKTQAQAAAAPSHKPASASDDWLKGAEDWNLDGHEETAPSTTELEGLPPPPSGINASTAMDKGFEFQKQGQFADAIKWLSWAVSLATGSSSSLLPKILSGRVSCFKEVGEYKKAVDDCCQVLEIDSSNTEILLQRAFLYESMEKYKLGVADLRQVLKSDPSNRLASNTLSRLAKMVD